MYRYLLSLAILVFVGCEGCKSTAVLTEPLYAPPCVQVPSVPSYHAWTPDMALSIPYPRLLPPGPAKPIRTPDKRLERLPPVNPPRLERLPPVEFPAPQEWIKPYDEEWGGLIVFNCKE